MHYCAFSGNYGICSLTEVLSLGDFFKLGILFINIFINITGLDLFEFSKLKIVINLRSKRNLALLEQ